MRNFLVLFVLFCSFYFGDSVLVKSDPVTSLLHRTKRQLNQNTYIAEKEGDVWAYVARRKYEDNNLIVGKYIQEWNSVYLPFHGKEYQFHDDIEILKTNGRHLWLPYPGYIPDNAIEGGYEGTAKLYIGRKFHEGKNLLGKIAEGFNSIYVPYFNKEIEFNENFDILVES